MPNFKIEKAEMSVALQEFGFLKFCTYPDACMPFVKNVLKLHFSEQYAFQHPAQACLRTLLNNGNL